jgi:predicted membrane channel-forming protein YqfA (hemolysin III family)
MTSFTSLDSGNHSGSRTPYTSADAPSNSSATQNGSNSSGNSQEQSLQNRSQIPLHLRFNRYVLDHYRPPTDSIGCLYSLFYIHNETVNIFTHAVPIFAILLSLPVILPWDDISIPYLPFVHIFACVAPWVGSTIYHLFMNHKQGYPMYRLLLMTDMIGIWIAQNLGSLTSICATFYCFGLRAQCSILTAFAVAALFSLFKAIKARCPWERRYSFLLPFGFRLAVVAARMSGYGGGHPDALIHLVMQDFVAITGAYIGASNIPERWFPGNLDLICNSHHFMHILVLYAAFQMHLAVKLDLVWMTDITRQKLSCL